jgi:hypothetical protein
MVSYTNAPATKLVATACLICRRPLLDAKSVETGIGPVCRERSGFDADPSLPPKPYQPLGVLDPDRSVQARVDSGNHRGAANALVNFAARTNDKELAARAAVQVGRLGYVRLSQAVLEGLSDILIRLDDGAFLVKASSSDSRWRWVVEQMGGSFDRKTKLFSVPAASKRRLWGALKRFHKGALATGPKGWFIV